LSHPDRVEFFEIPPVDIAADEIRRRVERGDPIGDVVPPAVAQLIAELSLYRPSVARG
jgi:nicotinic acid mononucleotide adenylyltransferase